MIRILISIQTEIDFKSLMYLLIIVELVRS